DEFPEFRRNVLEVLRQPLEDGHVTIARAAATCDFPSRFMLVAAMNPCPCGYADDPKHVCRCNHAAIQRYRARISGPLLDRIDLQLEVAPVPVAELADLPRGETSAEIRKRVVAAREFQKARFAAMEGVACNAEIPGKYLADVCKMGSCALAELRNMLVALDLSARAYDRVLKVARTIADLAGRDAVEQDDIYEATRYRALDQSYWR
ncbi:MAG: ATP-binding protein, partial [Kiritimatiellae bacterium]|nr:ATP-binding protein [Kiritimatiellia bacterium]